ncbi:4084_t:CDS:10, partial [Ambispora gerdemannii]
SSNHRKRRRDATPTTPTASRNSGLISLPPDSMFDSPRIESDDDDIQEEDFIQNDELSLDIETRRRVDAELNQRDVERARQAGRMPFVLDDGTEISEQDLAHPKTSTILEWLLLPNIRKTVERIFRRFLYKFSEGEGGSASYYGDRIYEMAIANNQTLEISYIHISEFTGILALYLINCPSEMLKIFEDIAHKVTLRKFEAFSSIHEEVHVRITELPTYGTLRDLRQENLNTLVRVSGVVTRRTGVFPQLKCVRFNCSKCGNVLGPFTQDAQSEVKVNFCSSCQSRGPFTLNSEQTIYRNYQRITLQESPGTVPAGRLPRHREVILLWDLIDTVKPGEEIEVTGIYRNNYDASLNTKSGFPVFATVIEANYISKKEDLYSGFRLTEDDKKTIQELAHDKNVAKRIIKSIAPSIFGHDDIKTAIALSLFGGVPKNVGGKHRLRGDINILMLGDPGTAKSQFLKYVEKTAHRAVFTTGQGASAVGLTASVRKDTVTREWTLEGGALVLADKGVCLIDEFDKMNDSDRTSIHEAMEQQSISISKAGIVTTLQARCAVIAAANPIRGRYNSSVPFSQNVDLTEPILSRFDVLCVVRDIVDPISDENLADFVVKSHMRSHPKFVNSNEDNFVTSINEDYSSDPNIQLIDQDILRKYIIYAKQTDPRLHQLDYDKLSQLYSDLRHEAGDSIPITVRHLESMLRLAEAHARMHLRDSTDSSDVDVAVDVVLKSFFASQKFSIRNRLQRTFAKYMRKALEPSELLFSILNSMLKEKMQNSANTRSRIEIPVAELQKK